MKAPYEFTDTKYMTSVQKATILEAWVRFLDNRCSRSTFTVALYRHFSGHLNHIAHYNIDGFWEEWFANEGRCREFMERFEREWAAGQLSYGQNSDYDDINRAMAETLRVRKANLYQFDLYQFDSDEYYARCLVALEEQISAAKRLGPAGIKQLVKSLHLELRR